MKLVDCYIKTIHVTELCLVSIIIVYRVSNFNSIEKVFNIQLTTGLNGMRFVCLWVVLRFFLWLGSDTGLNQKQTNNIEG